MRPDTQALLCVSAGAVVGWQSEFRVCSLSALVWIEIGKHVFRASHVPAPCFFLALFQVCSERWGLLLNGLQGPEVIRRMKSVTLRLTFMALRCSLLLALTLSLWSIGPRFRNSKKSVVTTRMARRPT